MDGIHFDYIRYPDNRGGQFPDDGMYRLYGKGKSRADWRRDNITRFVTKAYDRVKKVKPWVQVSSSPLGRYRALENVGGHGWTALETVYQDAGGRWMRIGKHDALYPMMYYKEALFYPLWTIGSGRGGTDVLWCRDWEPTRWWSLDGRSRIYLTRLIIHGKRKCMVRHISVRRTCWPIRREF